MTLDAVAAGSVAFELLDPRIQKWIWTEGWTGLRDIQEAAIPIILEGKDDVVVASPTASGKTEAAFLPIASAVATDAATYLRVLTISPLKALIDDQFVRLGSLFDAVDGPVHRWHGDVAQGPKVRFRRSPNGLLIITPESLEAMAILRGHEMRRMYAHLEYVVIDEVHAFIGTERGRQVQALLHRIEILAGRRIPRVALSATIGDLSMAAEYLRPGDGASVHVIRGDEGTQEIQVQIRGYMPASAESLAHPTAADEPDTIVGHMYETLRGGRHLVFANARGAVEQFADALRRRCESDQHPNEFFPHHGSLDRGVREAAEARLRDHRRPTTVVATSTLELGIDVGSVMSVGQIGAPSSVAGLRQRLGRSGRRGNPAVVRIHIEEAELVAGTAPPDRLRVRLVQAIAVVELLLRGWCEPPNAGSLHLSTLIQQTLSLIAQYGGIHAHQAWALLCDLGPFWNIDPPMFEAVLRSLAGHDLLAQTHDGLLVLGDRGERLVGHFEFYAAFQAQQEFRVVTDGETLGSMPIFLTLWPGDLVIFAGRRWLVDRIDVKAKLINVSPATGGRPPVFGGHGPPVHGEVHREMRRVLCDTSIPTYLNATAASLLSEGRAEFAAIGLGERSVIALGEDVLVFPWAGTRTHDSLKALLGGLGLKASVEGVCLIIHDVDADEVVLVLHDLCVGEPPSAQSLASTVRNKVIEKHDRFLTEDLLSDAFAASRIGVRGALEAARRVIAQPTDRSDQDYN